MGSSVGISKATNREELTAAIEEALKYDRRIVVDKESHAQRSRSCGSWKRRSEHICGWRSRETSRFLRLQREIH